MKKLLSREEYYQLLATLGNDYCPFCDIKRQIVLGTSEYWTWVANLSPYWPYNTLIISKVHKLDFDELSVEEFIDLQKFYKKIIDHLLSLNLRDTDGKIMRYFMFMIRTRKYEEESGCNKSKHLHINLCPDGENIKRFNLDPSAVNVDI